MAYLVRELGRRSLGSFGRPTVDICMGFLEDLRVQFGRSSIQHRTAGRKPTDVTDIPRFLGTQ